MRRINLWSAEIVVGFDPISRKPIHTGIVIASDDYPPFEVFRAEYDRCRQPSLLSGSKLYNLPPFITTVRLINSVVLI